MVISVPHRLLGTDSRARKNHPHRSRSTEEAASFGAMKPCRVKCQIGTTGGSTLRQVSTVPCGLLWPLEPDMPRGQVLL